MLWTLLVILLVLAIVSHTPYGSAWGPYPGPVLWVLVIVLLVLLLTGRI